MPDLLISVSSDWKPRWTSSPSSRQSAWSENAGTQTFNSAVSLPQRTISKQISVLKITEHPFLEGGWFNRPHGSLSLGAAVTLGQVFFCSSQTVSQHFWTLPTRWQQHCSVNDNQNWPLADCPLGGKIGPGSHHCPTRDHQAIGRAGFETQGGKLTEHVGSQNESSSTPGTTTISGKTRRTVP